MTRRGALGILVMFALNLLTGVLVAALVGESAEVTPDGTASVVTSPGRLALAALLAFLSFAIDGYVVGLKSPGRTIVKPGILAAVAPALRPGTPGWLEPRRPCPG